jgi:acetylornithine/succinyldiaminopimelate/putrescine aminotransferase
MKEESIPELYSEYVSKYKVEFFKEHKLDIVQKGGQGIYLQVEQDISGKKVPISLIDCRTSGGVYNLGRNHPVIIKAIHKGLDLGLDIGDHHLISEQRALLAQKMAEILPGSITKTQFCVSGGEAVDLAIKTARAFTKRKKIISATTGYHGVTGFALGATSKNFKKAFLWDQEPDFIQVPFGDREEFRKVADETIACVIFETIPATGGILIADKEYFSTIREICNSFGIIMIADEVQTGLGRTGELWGIYGGLYASEKIEPDIIVLGKGMSAGIYPMATVSYKPELEEIFSDDPFLHISTTGGSELGCYVTRKMFDLITKPKFLSNIQKTSKLFQDGLQNVFSGKFVQNIRGRGLMWGIEWSSEQLSMVSTVLMIKNGIFADFCGNFREVIKLMPPLIINEDDTTQILGRLETAYSQLKKMN